MNQLNEYVSLNMRKPVIGTIVKDFLAKMRIMTDTEFQ